MLGLDNKPTIKPKGTNTAYVCAIEARFNADKVIRQEKDWCISATNTCFSNKDITLHNDITKVGLHDTLSKRTITFTNRFRILAHKKILQVDFLLHYFLIQRIIIKRYLLLEAQSFLVDSLMIY